MKLGVMGAGLGGMKWEQALDYCQKVGLEAIELPVGAYPGKPFFDPAEVLKDAKAQQKIKDDCAKRNLEIIGLATHGNPVSPDPELRAQHEQDHDTRRPAGPEAWHRRRDQLLRLPGRIAGGQDAQLGYVRLAARIRENPELSVG